MNTQNLNPADISFNPEGSMPKKSRVAANNLMFKYVNIFLTQQKVLKQLKTLFQKSYREILYL
jgi:hypothetical protein